MLSLNCDEHAPGETPGFAGLIQNSRHLHFAFVVEIIGVSLITLVVYICRHASIHISKWYLLSYKWKASAFGRWLGIYRRSVSK